MGLPLHPQVGSWLRDLDDVARASVDSALAYLERHGRGAALPDVRHRMQRSRHFPNMSEVRIDLDDTHCYRILVGFGPHGPPALLLAGNKTGEWVSWYDRNIPIADERFDTYLQALERAKDQNR